MPNSKLKAIFSLGFILALHLACTAYMNSSFLSLFAGEKNVGLIYIVASLASIIVLFFMPSILERLGGYKFLLWSGALSSLSLLLLATLKNPERVIPVFILYFALNSAIIFALDELLEIFSKNNSLGKIRGLYLTVVSLAWVLSQPFSGEVLEKFSFSTVYFAAAFLMALFWLIALLSLRTIADPHYDDVVAWQSAHTFFGHKKLARAYKMSFLLQFFYAWMVIYTPLYLHAHLGFGWEEIGIIFTIMLLPFVLIQYPLGKHADKFGERNMLMVGFTIAAFATLSLFFVRIPHLFLWAALLFLTRTGAATIESMIDVYFFKHITPENDEYISVYRTAAPAAYVLAPLGAFLVFTFTPAFYFLYAVLSAILFYGIYLASTIRKDDI